MWLRSSPTISSESTVQGRGLFFFVWVWYGGRVENRIEEMRPFPHSRAELTGEGETGTICCRERESLWVRETWQTTGLACHYSNSNNSHLLLRQKLKAPFHNNSGLWTERVTSQQYSSACKSNQRSETQSLLQEIICLEYKTHGSVLSV